VDVVPGEEYPHYSSASARCAEHHSKHRVQRNAGQDRQEAERHDIPANQQLLWALGHGPVCVQAVHSMPTLLQLAARFLCSTFLQDWTAMKCYANPPWNMVGRVLAQVQSPPSGVDSSCLEVTTMVPNTSEHVARPSSANHIEPEETNQQGSHASSPSVNCMAHLRDKFQSQNLSEEDTALILKSWRAKTNKSYDSLFGKWHSWCAEWSFNPFSGPITNIANFLAQLCAEGYQYSSIKSCRSAISSVLKKVDRHNVGQHPLISRLLKDIFHDRFPYSALESSNCVELSRRPGRESIPLLKGIIMEISHVTCPSQSADLSQLELTRRPYKPNGVCFYPNVVAK